MDTESVIDIVAQETQPMKDNISVAKDIMGGMLGSEIVSSVTAYVTEFSNSIQELFQNPSFYLHVGAGAIVGGAFGIVLAAYLEKANESYGYNMARASRVGAYIASVKISSTIGAVLGGLGYNLFVK